jgi:uncharacterized protein DUF4352
VRLKEQTVCQNSNFLIRVRAPLWFIGLLLLAAIFIGVYAYFTTPLPYGLASYIQTPGGANVGVATPSATRAAAATASARAPAGQALVLGAASVAIQSVERNQDLTANNRGGPAGSFTVLDVLLQNVGGEPITPQPSDFRLLDDRGRVYAIDAEATRSSNAFAHRRDLFDASVPPGGQFSTYLAFETPPDSNAATLRVTLGYGEVELP